MDIFSYLLGKKAGSGQPPQPAKVSPEYVVFQGYPNAQLDLSWLDGKNLTIFKSMFNDCRQLESLDLTPFLNSKPVTLEYFLYRTEKLRPSTITNLNNLDVSRVTSFGEAFDQFGTRIQDNNNAELDLSNWKFTSASGCFSMFSNIRVKKIILNSNNNPNLTAVQNMFFSSGYLKELDLSNFDISKVTNANNMFQYTPNLTNESLNSIMGAFVNNTGLSASNKKLSYLGFTSTQVNVMTGLSNWTALQDAGWTTGY